MMEYLSERFAPGPLFAWACVVFLALIPLIWVRARRRQGRPTVRFSSISLVRGVGGTWATRSGFVIPLLRMVAVVALIVAMARPQSGGEYHDTSEGIAIQMVLDVSGSMRETDFLIDGQRARRIDPSHRCARSGHGYGGHGGG